MATPLQGTETVGVSTASGGVISTSPSNSRAIALLAQAIPAKVNTAIATAGNGVLSAAGLTGAVITRSGPTGAFSDATDTAANIIAALPAETPINFAWLSYVRNTTPYPQTVTGGVGVGVSGVAVIPANSTGLFLVQYTGAATIAMVGVAATPTDLGILEVVTPITTVGAGTLTAAAIAGGVINRSGPTAAYTDTTDTAANIIAALPNAQLGQSWEATIVNTTGFAETIAGGTGVTLSGLAGPIPPNATARYLCTYSGAGAVTMFLFKVNINAAGGRFPSTEQTQFGGGAGQVFVEGPLYREIDSSPVNPGGTAGDYVLSAFTIPAGSFDQAFRGLHVTAKGSFGATGNNKRIKIIANPATAVVGSVVGAGGTTVCDTGTVTTNGGGWQIEGEIYKYGAAGSNTQLCTAHGAVAGGTHLGSGGAPTLMAATESGAILVAITGNAATLASDIALSQVMIDAKN